MRDAQLRSGRQRVSAAIILDAEAASSFYPCATEVASARQRFLLPALFADVCSLIFRGITRFVVLSCGARFRAPLFYLPKFLSFGMLIRMEYGLRAIIN